MKRTVPPPDPATWDFTTCPDDEVRACLYYEAARESDAVKRYLRSASFRDSPITSTALGTKYIAFLCPEFPETPWLAINAETRRKRTLAAVKADGGWRIEEGLVVPNHALSGFIKLFAEDLNTAADLGMLFNRDEESAPQIGVRSMPDQRTTWAAIKLDWSKSETTLKREFAELLINLRAEFSKKSTGRKNHRDLLNGLAARRLRDHCKANNLPSPLDAAQEMWRTQDRHGCPYNDSRAMRRGVARTRKLLETLYQITREDVSLLNGTEMREFLSVPDI